MSLNNYILAGASFLVGAAVSGISAWVVAKKRYERIHQEEMNAVWADIKNNRDLRTDMQERGATKEELDTLTTLEHKYTPPTDIPANPFVDKPDLGEYAAKIREEGYTAPDLPETNDYIYEIDYSDLDEDEYERIDLVLYADGILADDGDYPLKNPKESVGDKYIEWMNGKDEIFVRNEKRKIDYDICRSALTYGELLDRHPETEQKLQYDDAVEQYYKDEDERDEDDEYDEEEE